MNRHLNYVFVQRKHSLLELFLNLKEDQVIKFFQLGYLKRLNGLKIYLKKPILKPLENSQSYLEAKGFMLRPLVKKL